jgi:TPR repeat protein
MSAGRGGRVLLAVALCASLLGCTPSDEGPDNARASLTPVSRPSAPTAQTGAPPPPLEPGTSSRSPEAAPQAASQAPAAATTPASDGSEPLRVAVAPSCAAPGAIVTATFEAPARAGLAMGVMYADGREDTEAGPIHLADADAAGAYRWEFSIGLTAPEGPAVVFATSTGPDRQRDGGGTVRAPFSVSRACA